MNLRDPDYTYVFNDIQPNFGWVVVTNHASGQHYQLQVSVDDSRLVSPERARLVAELADLVDLAVAVYTADRLSIRSADASSNIRILLPVRRPGNFSQHLTQMLEEILFWFTQDNWSLSFVQRTSMGRQIEIQDKLDFEPQSNTREVALWSGGLDSLAGYCNRLVTEAAETFTLFGTGGNSHVLNVQRTVYKRIRQCLPEAQRTNLVQIPIHLSVTSGIQKNRIMRARGFIFLLLGAVCALVYGQNRLSIYENGIGALNLPFRLSEVGLDHTRAVNPLSLLRMSDIVSTYMSKGFVFWNPFLFWTKAQMCQVFVNVGCTELVFHTISCDRRLRSRPMQCGRCSSCLLRRQALAVTQIDDRTGYATQRNDLQLSDRELHFNAMRHQTASLRTILKSENPWFVLQKRYPVLQGVVDELVDHLLVPAKDLQSEILCLYHNYVQEWELVERVVSKDILHGLEMQRMSPVVFDRSGGAQDGLQCS